MSAEAGVNGALCSRMSGHSSNNISKVAYLMKVQPPKKKDGDYYPFSWNDDQAGQWTLHVRHVATGKMVSVPVRVVLSSTK